MKGTASRALLLLLGILMAAAVAFLQPEVRGVSGPVPVSSKRAQNSGTEVILKGERPDRRWFGPETA